MPELLDLESKIPTSSGFADRISDEEFMAEVGPQSKEMCHSEKEEADVEPPPQRLKNLCEFMTCLEKMSDLFLS